MKKIYITSWFFGFFSMIVYQIHTDIAISDTCANLNNYCTTWGHVGECNTNPEYMLSQCKVTCKICQSIDCHDNSGFCRFVATNETCYTVKAIQEQCKWSCNACNVSSNKLCQRVGESKTPNGHIHKTFTRIIANYSNVTILSQDPFVIIVHNFFTEEEASELIHEVPIWQRSIAGDGVQKARTSSTSWCEASCLKNKKITENSENNLMVQIIHSVE